MSTKLKLWYARIEVTLPDAARLQSSGQVQPFPLDHVELVVKIQPLARRVGLLPMRRVGRSVCQPLERQWLCGWGGGWGATLQPSAWVLLLSFDIQCCSNMAISDPASYLHALARKDIAPDKKQVDATSVRCHKVVSLLEPQGIHGAGRCTVVESLHRCQPAPVSCRPNVECWKGQQTNTVANALVTHPCPTLWVLGIHGDALVQREEAIILLKEWGGSEQISNSLRTNRRASYSLVVWGCSVQKCESVLRSRTEYHLHHKHPWPVGWL